MNNKFAALLITIIIIIAIFIFFQIAQTFNLVISLPPFDSVTVPNIKSFSDWVGKSFVTISIFLNILQWLKVKAIQSPSTIDDKVLTYLLNFFSMNWFKNLTEKKNE